ncbi:MAG: hypothetical protein HC942_08735 [Microcoleus sp. SU_5_6]|nr:hypothetical protein [Microcoleus sp. SU_5_6]NJL66699.1 hypothetical protein [Microcoleus sp. SM1_3_4]
MHVQSYHPAVLSLPIFYAGGVVYCDPCSPYPLWHIGTRGAIALLNTSKLLRSIALKFTLDRPLIFQRYCYPKNAIFVKGDRTLINFTSLKLPRRSDNNIECHSFF